MSWVTAVDELLRLGLFLFGPGLLLALAVGFRGLRAWAFAPAVSVGLLALGAVVFGLLGIPWHQLSVAVLSVVIALAAWVLRRRFGRPSPSVVAREPVRRARSVMTVAGVVVGAALSAVPSMRGMGGPNLFPQDWDVMFHLSAVRFVLETSNASSFDLPRMVTPTGAGGFYPAGWHGLAALGGSDVTASTNVLLLLASAVALPLGMAVLARDVLPDNPAAGFFAPVMSAGFLSFPGVLIHRATLAAFLPYVLLPAVVAMTVVISRTLVARARRESGGGWELRTWVLLFLAAGGVAFAHPSGLLVYAVIVTPLLLSTACGALGVHRAVAGARHRGAGRRRSRGAMLLWGGGLILWFVAWWMIWVRFSRLNETGQRGNAGFLRGVWLALSDRGSVFVAVLVLVCGALVLLVRSARWLVGGMTALVGLAALAEVQSPLAEITRPWFIDPNRLRAGVAIVAAALIGVGLGVAFDLVRQRLRVRSSWAAALLVVGLATPVILGSAGLRAAERQELVAASYVDTTGEDVVANMASLEEIALLRRLPDVLEPGRAVIGNPFAGATFVYGIGGVPVVYTNLGANRSPDAVFLGLHFDELTENPEVCAALDRLGVAYFFHDPNTWFPGHPGLDQYRGLLEKPAEGLELVDQGGHAGVWRITACEAAPER